MTLATSEDQRDVQRSIRSWIASVEPIGTLRADPESGWRTHWQDLADLGVFSVAVPESAGGVGGTVADLAVMVESAGSGLVAGPVWTSALAATLVGRGVGRGRSAEDLCSGRTPCAVALSDASLDAVLDGDTMIVDGVLDVVTGGADGVAVLAPIGNDWFVIPADTPGTKIEPIVGIDGSLPIARIVFEAVRIPRHSAIEGVSTENVHDIAATLAAADAAGIAGWCLETAVAHAKTREQFGAPIGSFQAVKHLCAEMLCRVEKIRAAAWDAAVAMDSAPDELPLSAAVAATIALDGAVDTAKDCIQVLGGIGFTWEHDAHLYLRRALALRQLLGGSSRWRGRVAELTRAGVRRTLTVDLGDAENRRAEIRAEIGVIADAEDSRTALADSGLAAPHWPSPHGRDAGAALQLLYSQELQRAGLQPPDLVIGGWAVPTILEHGTARQIERFTGPTLRGEITWCQLFSEPEAGSDLASLRTSATRTDGGWTLRGHKIWTSLAREADWAICLARTNRDAAKHKGISYFLLDMKSAGIRVEPLREMTGDAVFNEVFLDDVFVPDECLVGEVDGGWKLVRTTLANERVAMSSGGALGAALEEVVTATSDNAAVTERLGGLIADGLVLSVLDLRATLRRLGGQDPGAESSVRKLVGVRHRQDLAEFALEATGSRGAAWSPIAKEMLLTRCLSIAGGTTQILLTVAAERILGLPRAG